jgi:hypothetical protein
VQESTVKEEEAATQSCELNGRIEARDGRTKKKEDWLILLFAEADILPPLRVD